MAALPPASRRFAKSNTGQDAKTRIAAQSIAETNGLSTSRQKKTSTPSRARPPACSIVFRFFSEKDSMRPFLAESAPGRTHKRPSADFSITPDASAASPA